MTSKLIGAIARNLRCPEKGFFGWVTKHILKRRNRYLELEAVRLCQIEPHHQVLEIGFGPGFGLEAAYEKVKGGGGRVCGVDISLYMVDEASRRMRQALPSGQVDICVGGVSQLPYNTDTFDRVFHVNSYYFWPNMHRAVLELHRVMKPGGVMVATLNLEAIRLAQERGLLQLGHPDPLKFMWALEQHGFEEVHIEYLNHQGRDFQAIFAKVNQKPELDLEKGEEVEGGGREKEEMKDEEEEGKREEKGRETGASNQAKS